MNAFVLLFSSKNQAMGQGRALFDDGWNVVVTGPNDEVEVWKGQEEILGHWPASWTVFASKKDLLDPSRD